jgi:hypothetical protein
VLVCAIAALTSGLALRDCAALKNAIKLTSSGGTKRDWVFFFGVKLDADLWLGCLSKGTHTPLV